MWENERRISYTPESLLCARILFLFLFLFSFLIFSFFFLHDSQLTRFTPLLTFTQSQKSRANWLAEKNVMRIDTLFYFSVFHDALIFLSCVRQNEIFLTNAFLYPLIASNKFRTLYESIIGGFVSFLQFFFSLFTFTSQKRKRRPARVPKQEFLVS